MVSCPGAGRLGGPVGPGVQALRGAGRCPALPGRSQRAGSDGWQLAPGKAVTAVEVWSPWLGAATRL